MSNSFFRFKQFTVWQEHCAMKVSTDACIQGAWTPIATDVKRILDVGAGTGLLSLMLAQRAPTAMIDAVELNKAAAKQAGHNVASAPFANQISVVPADAAQWRADVAYDLIICNPPFFQNALKGDNAARNDARHMQTLNADTIIRILLENLSPDGTASLLWPKPEHERFAVKAETAGLSLREQLNIAHRPGRDVSRVVSIWSLNAHGSGAATNLYIKDNAEQYTEDFIYLLSPFYLAL